MTTATYDANVVYAPILDKFRGLEPHGWHVHIDPGMMTANFNIKGPNEMALYVFAQGTEPATDPNWENRKVSISCCWLHDAKNVYHKPNSDVDYTAEINVSLKRSPGDIAADILRRLIPQYVAAFPAVKAARDASNKRYNSTEEAGKALAAKFNGRYHADRGEVSVRSVHKIMLNHDGSGATIHTYDVPMDKAEAILAILVPQ